MSDKESMWRSRVTAWRASGQTAEVFVAGKGFTAGTLRWWSSRLRREAEAAPAPAIQLARVVRTRPDGPKETTPPRAELIVELLDVSARITITGQVDADALTTVIGALREARR